MDYGRTGEHWVRRTAVKRPGSSYLRCVRLACRSSARTGLLTVVWDVAYHRPTVRWNNERIASENSCEMRGSSIWVGTHLSGLGGLSSCPSKVPAPVPMLRDSLESVRWISGVGLTSMDDDRGDGMDDPHRQCWAWKNLEAIQQCEIMCVPAEGQQFEWYPQWWRTARRAQWYSLPMHTYRWSSGFQASLRYPAEEPNSDGLV